MAFQNKQEALQAAKQALATIQEIGAPLPVQAQKLVDFFIKITTANEKTSTTAAPPPPETCEEFVKKYPARYEAAKNAILAIKDIATATNAELVLNELNNPFESAIRKGCLTKDDEMVYESEILDLINRFRANAKPYLQDVTAPEIVALFAEIEKIKSDVSQLSNLESVAALKIKLEYAKQNFEAYRYKARIDDCQAIKRALGVIEKAIDAKHAEIEKAALIPLNTGVVSVAWEPRLTLISFDINEKTDVLAHKLAIAIKDGKQKKAAKLREKIDELFEPINAAVDISVSLKFYEYQQGGKKYWGIQPITAVRGGANGYLTVDVVPSAPETGNGVSLVYIEITVSRDEVEAKSFDWDALVNLPEAVINDIPTRNVSETTDVIAKLLAKHTLKPAKAKSNICFRVRPNPNDPTKAEFTITEPSKENFNNLSFSTNRVKQNRSFTHNIVEINKVVKTEVESLLNK